MHLPKKSLIAAAVAAALASTPAAAQGAGETGEEELTEVVVTARRFSVGVEFLSVEFVAASGTLISTRA